MKQILFYKPGALSQKDRERCSKNGFLPIEATDFEAFRLIDPSIPTDRSTILKAALIAISTADATNGPKTLFGKKMAELLASKLAE